MVDLKLQATDLKAEVRELRSGGIPRFNPQFIAYVSLEITTTSFNIKNRRRNRTAAETDTVTQHYVDSYKCNESQ